jgi:hypothetical protein
MVASAKIKQMSKKPSLISHKRRWWWQSVSGLLLTGAGLSMAIEAGIRKAGGEDWIIAGTLALIIFQTGICLVADSVRFRDGSKEN